MQAIHSLRCLRHGSVYGVPVATVHFVGWEAYNIILQTLTPNLTGGWISK